MTITAKLRLNALIVAGVVCLLAATGIVSLNMVKGKLSYLIQTSTPFQVHTTELQRSLQEAVAALVKLSVAANQPELVQAKGALAEALAEVQKSEQSVAALAGQPGTVHEEFSRTAQQLVALTERRLKSETEVAKAQKTVSERGAAMATTLKELDRRITALQSTTARSFATSFGASKGANAQRVNLEMLRSSLDQLQLLLAALPAARERRQLVVLKSKLTGIIDNFQENPTVRESKDYSAAAKAIKQKLGSILALHGQLLKQGDAAGQQQLDQMLTEAREQSIGTLLASFDVAVDRASRDSSSAGRTQEVAFLQSNVTSGILAENAALVSAGLMLDSVATRLFLAVTPEEVAALDADVNRLFSRINASQHALERALSGARATAELKLLQAAEVSLRDMHDLLSGATGIIVQVRGQLALKRETAQMNHQVRTTVQRFADKGKGEILTAHREQEESARGVNRIVQRSITLLAAVGAAVLLFSIFFSFLIGRSITGPIRDLVGIAQRFGDGDFSGRMDEKRRDEFGVLAVHLNHANVRLSEITSKLAGAIRTLSSHSRQLSRNAQELANSAHLQTEQTAQSACAMTQMTQTIADVAGNALAAAEASKDTLLLAARGNLVVAETVVGIEQISVSVHEAAVQVNQLGASSEKIGAIVQVINEIADQTNLLALNAAIEAARAGESGRGFAVVADEVRKLARHTTEATAEIAGMVREIQAGTARSVLAMETGNTRVAEEMHKTGEALHALESIVEASNRGADMVGRIATASEQQSATAQQVASSVENISEITRSTETKTREIMNSSCELQRTADELTSMAQWFKMAPS
jgi:methyl-accepting chemotaxis protein